MSDAMDDLLDCRERLRKSEGRAVEARADHLESVTRCDELEREIARLLEANARANDRIREALAARSPSRTEKGNG